MKSKWVVCLAMGICVGSRASALGSIQFDYDWSDPHQPNEGCGHLALLNILDYWDEKFGALVPQNLEPNLGDNQADALSKALQDDEYLGPGVVSNIKMWAGLKEWFKDRKVELLTQQTGMYEGEIPSWSWYKTEIDKGEKVLLLFDWGGINHWVAAFGKSTSPNKFVVHDPNVRGQNEQGYTYTVKDDGYMHLTYRSKDAKITQMISVTAIPEPSTLTIWLLLATLGVSVGWWRRTRRAG